MTRRRSGADPTSRRGMPVEDALAELARILATLNPRERGVLVLRFGLRDATPRTWTEIGQVYGVTRERVRQIEHEAMARLQETAVPYEWLLDEMPLIPAEVRCRVLDLDPPDPLPPLVHCPRHRSYWAPGVLDHLHPREQCGNCPCLVLWGAGRPRKYCSNACKQAAYRRRTAESNARVAGRAGRSGGDGRAPSLRTNRRIATRQ